MQFIKAHSPIDSIFTKLISFKLVQSLNPLFPILVKLLGNAISVKLEQFIKPYLPILLALPKLTSFKYLQLAKAPYITSVTFFKSRVSIFASSNAIASTFVVAGLIFGDLVSLLSHLYNVL